MITRLKGRTYLSKKKRLGNKYYYINICRELDKCKPSAKGFTHYFFLQTGYLSVYILL